LEPLEDRCVPATLNLTTAGSSGPINGAVFQQTSPLPTGTGVVASFLRLQNNGTEQGYNTSARPVEFNEKTDPNFNRDLLLSEVPVVNINGTAYRQFLLDVNEGVASSTTQLISLDKLQLFQSNTPGVNNYANLGTKVYDLDAGGDNSVILDASLNTGPGLGDMYAYVPDALFDPNLQYVYLYSS